MAVGKRIHFYRGHFIYPGRLKGSADDVRGTWYVVPEDLDEVVTTGRGFETLMAAKEFVDSGVDSGIGVSPWKYRKIGDKWMAFGLVEDKDWTGDEIEICTLRGERHVRKVAAVFSRHRLGRDKAIVYLTLEPDAHIEKNAIVRSITRNVHTLLEEIKSWQSSFAESHEAALPYLGGHEVEEDRDEVMCGFEVLLVALDRYRKSNVSQKHPSATWLEETRAIENWGQASNRE